MEEEKLTPKKEEKATSILDEIKQERAALEKVRDETKVLVDKLTELKAEELIAGHADKGQKKEEKKELTPKEYADAVSHGIIPQ